MTVQTGWLFLVFKSLISLSLVVVPVEAIRPPAQAKVVVVVPVVTVVQLRAKTLAVELVPKINYYSPLVGLSL
jgi:hypothetical protein